MPCRFVVPIATTVLLAGCAVGEQTVTAPQPGASARPTASPSPTAAAARILDVRIAGGEVSGVEQRVSVALGESIVVRVTSDVADEVHIHGYDVRQEVAAGGTVEFPLTATIPGGFEVELENLGRTLFQLRVA